jgi:hypothetical protein
LLIELNSPNPAIEGRAGYFNNVWFARKHLRQNGARCPR